MTTKLPPTRLILETTLVIILFGFISILVKFTAANAFTVGIFRLAVASVLMYGVVRSRRELGALTRRQWGVLSLLGLVFGFHWLTYFLSIKTATASVAVLGLSSFGMVLLFLGWLLGRARPGWVDLAAVATAILGNSLIIPQLSLQNNITRGLLLGILSGAALAWMPILHQKFVEISTTVRTFGQFLFALLFFMLFLPFSRWELAVVDWLVLTTLAMLCTFVAHFLWVRITTQLSTSTTSVLYYLTIPVAMVFSYLFLDEVMTQRKILGAALILTANLVALYSQQRRRVFLNARV